jgi:putative flippase GtrA
MINTLSRNYLIAGFFNTLISYVLSIILYNILSPYIHLIPISFFTYTISISISFFTYKYYVFKTRGKWLDEYLRFYFIYGAVSLVIIFCLWILVNFLHIKFWIAQGCLVPIGVFLSYFGNKYYAFNAR